jgi:hypothetical protein
LAIFIKAAAMSNRAVGFWRIRTGCEGLTLKGPGSSCEATV